MCTILLVKHLDSIKNIPKKTDVHDLITPSPIGIELNRNGPTSKEAQKITNKIRLGKTRHPKRS